MCACTPMHSLQRVRIHAANPKQHLCFAYPSVKPDPLVFPLSCPPLSSWSRQCPGAQVRHVGDISNPSSSSSSTPGEAPLESRGCPLPRSRHCHAVQPFFSRADSCLLSALLVSDPVHPLPSPDLRSDAPPCSLPLALRGLPH